MSIAQHSLSSHTAGVSVQRPEAKRSGKYWVAVAASAGLAFFGSIFGAMSYFPAKWSNGIHSKAEHDSLTQHFSEQIAERFGIDPSHVTREHLYALAAKDVAFAKLLEASVNDQKNMNRKDKVIAGVSAFMPPGLGIVPNLGATVVAASAASIFDKDNLTVVDVTDHIEAKIAGGELVTADDLMLLRVAQNDTLAEEIKASYGDQFHKLDAQKRVQVLEAMPALFETANRDSTALNNGLVKTQDLAIERAPAPAKWSAGAKSRSQQAVKQNGFRAKLEADRAAARAAQQQL